MASDAAVSGGSRGSDSHALFVNSVEKDLEHYLASSEERRQDALELVNRFYRQIRYGCKNPACTTSTCLSSQKRRAKGPFRRFTVLSARAIANFLASEENASEKLCPHSPVGNGMLLDEIFLAEKPSSHSTDERIQVGHKKSERGKKKPVSKSRDDARQEKDPKSFIQFVFDTTALKSSGITDVETKQKLIRNRTLEGETLSSEKASQFQQHIDTEIRKQPLCSVLWKRLDAVFPAGFEAKQSKDFELGQACEGAEIINLALLALDNSLYDLRGIKGSVWDEFVKLRNCGRFVPSGKENRRRVEHILRLMDCFEDDVALRLAIKVTRAYAAGLCHSESSRAHNTRLGKETAAEVGFAEFVDRIMQGISNCNLDDARGGPLPALFKARCKTINSPHGEIVKISDQVYRELIENQCQKVSHAAVVLEWLRSVFLHEWDGKPTFHKYGAVGGALEFMARLYEQRHRLNLPSDVFWIPPVSDRLDHMDVPVEWSTLQPSKATSHLLSYPFIFPPATLVTYFRAINYNSMVKMFESSFATAQLVARMTGFARDERVPDRLRIARASYLVLEIRRDNILKDALDQLWKRQKRELLRPLKIRMGMDEGEEGIDHGGVQQEFFRLAFVEALNPDYGLFTTDSRTQMSWFMPGSLEPLYKFELLGLLASLAVYNGVTLPVTFPLAFYHRLLGSPIFDISDIEDGWPDLAKGLKQLLGWNAGNVADVFMRSYVFSMDTPAGIVHIDMERPYSWPPVHSDTTGPAKSANKNGHKKAHERSLSIQDSLIGSPDLSSSSSEGWTSLHPSDPSSSDTEFVHVSNTNGIPTKTSPTAPLTSDAEEANMVTNFNRKKYIEDYISWLTDKSIRPQYEAFSKGFYHCFDRKTFSLFTPEALRDIVQGSQVIDIDELEAVTKYENGYHPRHKVIEYFWFVVRSFSDIQLRKLLEFITASDRVPVKGISSMAITILRNGLGDERLPTSMTCFGRLLLPEYSSWKVLEEKLCLALENSQGFGTA